MKPFIFNHINLCLLIVIFVTPCIAAEKIVVVFGGGYMLFYFSNLASGMYIDFLNQFEKEHAIMKTGQAFKFEHPSDLFGKKIGIIRGNSYGEYDQYFKLGKITAVPVDSNHQLHQMLMIERVDAIFGNRHANAFDIKLNHLDMNNFQFSSKANGFLKFLEEKYVLP